LTQRALAAAGGKLSAGSHRLMPISMLPEVEAGLIPASIFHLAWPLREAPLS
jgi:hypothetical protein